MLLNIAIMIAGLVILGIGGEALVKGASRLARAVGVSALVVGLTVVAFGTSAPEAAVSISAGAAGEDDIAVANVVGSCTMNIMLVLALAALARPLRISRSVLRNDLPVMLLATAVFMLMAANHRVIERWMGLTLLAGLVLYTLNTMRLARSATTVVEYEFDTGLPAGKSVLINFLLMIVGIAALVGGARMIVYGAVEIAEAIGVSKRIIGLTIVALGTSLPEVATCVVAARRGQPDIAVGNVIGSNIFNILAVVGLASTAFPLRISEHTLFVDGPVMLLAGVMALPVLRTGRLVSRREGGMLLGLYAVYLCAALVYTRT